MNKRTIYLIPRQRSAQLSSLAEQARISLNRYSGIDVDYDAVGLQTLDEWIERHLHQFPEPSAQIRTVWGAFLGETFRRRYTGRWGIHNGTSRPRLGVVCPRNSQSPLFVDIMDQITRRIQQGMSESLAFYYAIKSVDIKSQ